MNRQMGNMISDIVTEEMRHGLDDIFGKIRREFDRNIAKNEEKFDFLKDEIKFQCRRIFDDISRKSIPEIIGNFKDKHELSKVHMERLLFPVSDQLCEIRKSVADLQKILREERDQLPKEPRKQNFKFKASSKLKTNIMSLKCYETMNRIDRLIPADPEFVLQRKNGTFHEIIGKTYVTMRSKDGWRDFKFYVIGTLSGNAYLNKNTVNAISY